MSYFHARSSVGLALLIFAVGLILGNIVLLSIAFVQIIFMVSSLAIQQPRKISFKRDKTQTNALVGQTIERNISISVEKGIGLVIFNDVIPEEFELVEGSNYKLFWKWIHPLEVKMNYKIRCAKRGEYQLFSPFYESRHPLNMMRVDREVGQVEGTLVVRPRLIDIRRMRSLRTLSAIPIPLGSMAKGGLPTTDFRELREYSYGEPYTSINWKATARFDSRGARLPYVNVFEKEGRKVVWLILDVSSSMSVGTSVRNALDCVVEATNALSHFYLERGCSVGLYICTRKGVIKPPDTGRRQYQVILKELIRARIDYASQPLTTAVERCGKYSAGTNPLFIIMTRITTSSASSIMRAVKEARKYFRPLRGRRHTIVVDVNPYGLVSNRPEERLASQTLQIFTKQEALAVRRLGALLVRWDPTEQNFSNLMLRGLRVPA
jgi:uncharacterized protein (DUF58 family)